MKQKDTRVDHSQYDPLPTVAEPLATAATNEMVPGKAACGCGSENCPAQHGIRLHPKGYRSDRERA
jgi:hypothetical protein